MPFWLKLLKLPKLQDLISGWKHGLYLNLINKNAGNYPQDSGKKPQNSGKKSEIPANPEKS